jgi:alkylation response protein AidB-like acyl-CoA dehydrogenase
VFSSMQDQRPEPDVATFRRELDAWLDERADELAPAFAGAGTLGEQMTQLAKVKGHLFEDGWMQWGWPERVGGRGGSPLLRAVVGEAVVDRDLVVSGYFAMTEVLAPTVVDFAADELAAEFLPRLLSGREMWCQGFSEPGTGSDLSSLSCRAVQDGDHWVVSGQKLWTSLSQYSQRCVLLTRTGPPGSRHEGITAFFVDLDTPGITVRPFPIISGDDEFAEVFFDDVRVPAERMVGGLHGGWNVAMSLLPYERSTSFWFRIAFLRNRLAALAATVDADPHTEAVVGEAFVQLHALRARSRSTQHRLAGGHTLGPETSVDKALVAAAEQRLFDAARALLPAGTIELAADPASLRWRDEYLYSRAASIYGGSAEIQRNIIAKRLLGLGDDA